jgi:hypothetical protein
MEPAHRAVVGSLQAGVFLLSVLGLFDDPGSAAAAWYRHVLSGALDAQAAADAILFEYFEATLHGIHDRLLDALRLLPRTLLAVVESSIGGRREEDVVRSGLMFG